VAPLKREDALRKIADLTSGEMPVMVFEATENKHSVGNSFNFLANSGRLVRVGLFQGNVTFHRPDAHRYKLTLLCSRNGADSRRIIARLKASKIDISLCVTHRVIFAEAIHQFTIRLRYRRAVLSRT
jgi:threonine dehydrogenase-like Zn-dependent dehydrogenase